MGLWTGVTVGTIVTAVTVETVRTFVTVETDGTSGTAGTIVISDFDWSSDPIKIVPSLSRLSLSLCHSLPLPLLVCLLGYLSSSLSSFHLHSNLEKKSLLFSPSSVFLPAYLPACLPACLSV